VQLTLDVPAVDEIHQLVLMFRTREDGERGRSPDANMMPFERLRTIRPLGRSQSSSSDSSSDVSANGRDHARSRSGARCVDDGHDETTARSIVYEDR